ncbi:hypothetical protein CH63R_06290 [Colletotrichum higginsianum IMI 349063]|uniref:Uncharacterized protein n=1 Tax=Colletotrichum higginsianum (strain IMI 349063) TaxID=759273 RepID=A0A1B7YFN2_COLHI|nr:hypothetical protein CH63R_06290 [Colletotrichum higginsianum IMI 349063]OBR10598.1 hypothetical protein CH63R_06290 [Colletotrichum higginsianum IMI 349063]
MHRLIHIIRSPTTTTTTTARPHEPKHAIQTPQDALPDAFPPQDPQEAAHALVPGRKRPPDAPRGPGAPDIRPRIHSPRVSRTRHVRRRQQRRPGTHPEDVAHGVVIPELGPPSPPLPPPPPRDGLASPLPPRRRRGGPLLSPPRPLEDEVAPALDPPHVPPECRPRPHRPSAPPAPPAGPRPGVPPRSPREPGIRRPAAPHVQPGVAVPLRVPVPPRALERRRVRRRAGRGRVRRHPRGRGRVRRREPVLLRRRPQRGLGLEPVVRDRRLLEHDLWDRGLGRCRLEAVRRRWRRGGGGFGKADEFERRTPQPPQWRMALLLLLLALPLPAPPAQPVSVSTLGAGDREVR